MLRRTPDLSKDCKVYYQRVGNIALLMKERILFLEVQNIKRLQAQSNLLELCL